jgi:hypothetical protein
MRRHLAGETEQAKKDLERLAQVRARREAAAKMREAEGRAAGWTAEGVESSDSDSGKFLFPSPIDYHSLSLYR